MLWCDKMYKNISKKLLHLTIEFFEPDGSTSCTIAYQEYKTDGSKGDAYFVEAAL